MPKEKLPISRLERNFAFYLSMLVLILSSSCERGSITSHPTPKFDPTRISATAIAESTHVAGYTPTPTPHVVFTGECQAGVKPVEKLYIQLPTGLVIFPIEIVSDSLAFAPGIGVDGFPTGDKLIVSPLAKEYRYQIIVNNEIVTMDRRISLSDGDLFIARAGVIETEDRIKAIFSSHLPMRDSEDLATGESPVDCQNLWGVLQ